MPNTCSTGCCSTNVPVRDSSHASCHCQDTHWCESPPIVKRVSNCDDGCCKTSTTSIRNSDTVRQYVNGLRAEHLGHSEHNIGRTLHDISKGKITDSCCPTPTPCVDKAPDFSISGSNCGTGSCTVDMREERNEYYGLRANSCDTGCNTGTCGDSSLPSYMYEDLNCSTGGYTSCCSGVDKTFVIGLANRVRGRLNHNCHTYGDIQETIKEIPSADVYLVNHEFIDLMIQEILGCLPINNLSQSTVKKVRSYVDQYYVYYKDLSQVGSLVINDVVSLDKNLIGDAVTAGRTRAVLQALSDRLEGRIYEYEQ